MLNTDTPLFQRHTLLGEISQNQTLQSLIVKEMLLYMILVMQMLVQASNIIWVTTIPLSNTGMYHRLV